MMARLAAIAAAALFSGGGNEAHPVHTTLTVITVDQAGAELSFNIRTFADDFSASVATFAGRSPPADSGVTPADVARYVRARFALVDVNGNPIVLQPCGVIRAREVYLLCFRAAVRERGRGTRINNQMLAERHADQVNIVRIEYGRARKSFLFSKGSALSAL